MKMMHYPNTIRSHLVTIVPIAPFTPKSTSKLRSALHIKYSIVFPRFISHASFPTLMLLNLNNHYNHGFPTPLTTTTMFNVYGDYLVCSVPAIAHIIRY